MSIDIVVATDLSGGIGFDGKLLKKVKIDMQHFKKLTINSSCLMGRNTWNEIASYKPLIDRKNIILTRDENFKVEDNLHTEYNISIRHNALEVIEEYKRENNRLCIIGGGELYRQSLPYANRVFLTMFYEELEADTHISLEYITEHFNEVKREEYEVDGLRLDFIDYVRKENV